MPAEGSPPASLPALLAQLRAPSSRSTASVSESATVAHHSPSTRSLASTSRTRQSGALAAADSTETSNAGSSSSDDDDASSLEGLAQRLSSARRARHRTRAQPPSPRTTTADHLAPPPESPSNSQPVIHDNSDDDRQPEHNDDDNNDDDCDKDEEDNSDEEDDQDRVHFVARAEGHPDPRDLLRAQLAKSSPLPTRTRTADPGGGGRGRGRAEEVAFRKQHDAEEVEDEDAQDASTRLPPPGGAAAVRTQPPPSGPDKTSPRTATEPADEAASSSAVMYMPRRYFILSTAGKLVYTSDASEEAATGLVGVMQAIVSIFADEGDKIRYIDVGQTKISFLLKAPLYLVVVSSQGEPEPVLRQHLDYLHLQVLSVVTLSQLQNIFSKRSNFDLRQLISGTEPFFDSVVSALQTNLAVAFSSIPVYRLAPSLRADLARALDPGRAAIRDLDLLYVLLLAEGRLVTLLRPKRHSIHPTDLHLLLSTVYAPRKRRVDDGGGGGGGEAGLSLKHPGEPQLQPGRGRRPRQRPSPLLEPGAESWFPICLPRFNPRGFLHAYVSFFETSSSSATTTTTTRAAATATETLAAPDSDGGTSTLLPRRREDGVGLVILSSQRDAFGKVQLAAQEIKARLTASTSAAPPPSPPPASPSPASNRPRAPPASAPITAAAAADGGLVHSILMSRAQQSYSLGELAIPGLRHFVYKDRNRVQVTMPRWEGEYAVPAPAPDPAARLRPDHDHRASHQGHREEEVEEEDDDEDDDGGQGSEAAEEARRARMRLMTLYQRLHAALHSRTGTAAVREGRGGGGGGGGASVQYLRTSQEAVLGWLTPEFELYLSVSRLLPHAAVVTCARGVSRWVKQDEARLFLSGKGAGVF
ncbi:hypothetical protein JCM3774_000198 [Rhodotorula dairenensis]